MQYKNKIISCELHWVIRLHISAKGHRDLPVFILGISGGGNLPPQKFEIPPQKIMTEYCNLIVLIPRKKLSKLLPPGVMFLG